MPKKKVKDFYSDVHAQPLKDKRYKDLLKALIDTHGTPAGLPVADQNALKTGNCYDICDRLLKSALLKQFFKDVYSDPTCWGPLETFYDDMIKDHGQDLEPDQRRAIRDGDPYAISMMMSTENGGDAPSNPIITWTIGATELT